MRDTTPEPMPDIVLSVAPPHASVSEQDISELEQLRDVLQAEVADTRVVIDVRSIPSASIGFFVPPEALLVKVLESAAGGVAGGAASYSTQRALKAIEKWRITHRITRPVRVTDHQDRETRPESDSEAEAAERPQ